MNAKIDISNVVLKTERLILRPWTLDDLDWYNNNPFELDFVTSNILE